MSKANRSKQIPMMLEIGGESWAVYRVSAAFLKKEEAEGAVGLTDYTDYRVYILKTLTKKSAEETLYHELLHCGFAPNRASGEGSINEELACELGAGAIKGILKQHAKIKKWLKKFNTTTPEKDVDL